VFFTEEFYPVLNYNISLGTPIAALTGTADERTLAVVEKNLLLKNPFKIMISPNRQNIRFSVEKYKKEIRKLLCQDLTG
jgi:superfamily II DNA helicase RecQ